MDKLNDFELTFAHSRKCNFFPGGAVALPEQHGGGARHGADQQHQPCPDLLGGGVVQHNILLYSRE